jgi:hypothetical protein
MVDTFKPAEQVKRVGVAGSLSGRRLEKKDEQKITYVLGPFHVGYPPLELIRAVAGRRSNFADIITQGVGIHHERPFFVIKMNRCCRSSGRFARASFGGHMVRGRLGMCGLVFVTRPIPCGKITDLCRRTALQPSWSS